MQRAPSAVLAAPQGRFRLRAVRAGKWVGAEGSAVRLTAGTAAIWEAESAAAAASPGAFRLRLAGLAPRYLRLVPAPALLVDGAADATLLEVRETDEPREAGQVHVALAGRAGAYMGGGKDGIEVRTAAQSGRRWQLDPAPDAPAAAPAGGAARYACPYAGCGASGLSEDELCVHCERTHARNNSFEVCPVCAAHGGPTAPQGRAPWGFSSHLHSAHGPRAEHNAIAAGVMTYAFALVVCRHPDGRFLLVEECCSQGWWLPGGRVDPGETFQEAAIRETVEEAGVEAELTGVLAIEYAPHRHGRGDYYARQRIVFLARPKHPERPPKSAPDYESVGAEWIAWPELERLVRAGQRHVRGHEPLVWFKHVHDGGAVHSMKLLKGE